MFHGKSIFSKFGEGKRGRPRRTGVMSKEGWGCTKFNKLRSSSGSEKKKILEVTHVKLENECCFSSKLSGTGVSLEGKVQREDRNFSTRASRILEIQQKNSLSFFSDLKIQVFDQLSSNDGRGDRKHHTPNATWSGSAFYLLQVHKSSRASLSKTQEHPETKNTEIIIDLGVNIFCEWTPCLFCASVSGKTLNLYMCVCVIISILIILHCCSDFPLAVASRLLTAVVSAVAEQGP